MDMAFNPTNWWTIAYSSGLRNCAGTVSRFTASHGTFTEISERPCTVHVAPSRRLQRGRRVAQCPGGRVPIVSRSGWNGIRTRLPPRPPAVLPFPPPPPPPPWQMKPLITDNDHVPKESCGSLGRPTAAGWMELLYNEICRQYWTKRATTLARQLGQLSPLAAAARRISHRIFSTRESVSPPPPTRVSSGDSDSSGNEWKLPSAPPLSAEAAGPPKSTTSPLCFPPSRPQLGSPTQSIRR